MAKNKIERVIETDVLVIGGGAAGTRAALEAHRTGANVNLVVKGVFGLTGNRGGGSTSSNAKRWLHLLHSNKKYSTPDDEVEGFFQRSIQAGLGLANRHLLRILVDGAIETKQILKKWGLVLGPTNPNNPSAIECRIAPMPGLANVIRASGEIAILERIMVTDLLIQNNVCVGALGIDEETGQPFLMKAGSTILATGGNAQLYMFNYHPSCITGDGYAMGYDAGAELMNMEFEQMTIGLVYPISTSIRLWAFYPKILNANGVEFIQNYIPQGITLRECIQKKMEHGPYSTRDSSKYLEIAMIKETKAGRANEHNAFYLEVPHGIKAKRVMFLPEFVDWYRNRGVDLWSQKYIEINVNHHCSNGGLRIDENAQTTIPGLYAVGETAAGPHGADRLGGAMMLFCQVFGARAGKHAAATAKTREPSSLDNQIVESKLKRIIELKESKGNQKPFELTKILRRKAWENLLAVRTKDGLTELLEEVEQIRNRMSSRLSVENPAELIAALELGNLLLVGETVANAALMRTESRGGHFREDFPERDDTNWLKAITVKKVDGKMKLGTLKIDDKWESVADDLGWWG